MSISTDPLTRAEVAIWDALVSHQPFAALVRRANRISGVTEQRNPWAGKENVSTADLPECELVPVSWSHSSRAGQRGTSNSFYFTVTYELRLRSGEMRSGAPEGASALLYESTVAIWKACTKMPGVPEVTIAFPEGGQFAMGRRGESPATDSRPATPGIEGWWAVNQIVVEIKVDRTQIGANP